jgi:uncharacterized integral membrane protein
MEGRSPAPAKRDTPWTLIVFGVAALYVLLVAVLNSEQVEIDFLFFSAEISKLVLILLCLGIGFAAGFLLDRWRHRRKGEEA